MIKTPRTKINNLFLIGFLAIILAACNLNTGFYKYQSVEQSGWSKDSASVFNVQVDDTTSAYNVLLSIRNGGEYPYQNLWLFITRTGPDSMILNDTVECYLADLKGKWLGSGIGSINEISVLYLQNTSFSKKGEYTYSIKQGMREEKLKGISEIGIKIETVH